MWLISVTRSQVWMGSRCVKFGVIALTLSYWSLEVQHATSWQRTLWGSDKNYCCSTSEVLNSSPRAPPLCIFCMSLFVNTPDSDNQLVRSALHAWTVFRLTCSLHRVHCSLLPEQGKSAEVYFISEHSFMDLRCATSSRTDECDIIYICKYIQF